MALVRLGALAEESVVVASEPPVAETVAEEVAPAGETLPEVVAESGQEVPAPAAPVANAVALLVSAAVAQWVDELEASAPPRSQLDFALHVRAGAGRLAELLS